MQPVVSLVTLGVADVESAAAFYERWGWRRSPASVQGVVAFFATPGAHLALFGNDDLVADSGSLAPATLGSAAPAGQRVALAMNLPDRAAVDAALAAAVEAGATLARPAHVADWGGYSGYVADPDGHLWEVAHNPGWPLGPDGRPQLP